MCLSDPATYYELPPHQHVYGKPYSEDSEGVKELTSSWATPKRAPPKTKTESARIFSASKPKIPARVIESVAERLGGTAGSFKPKKVLPSRTRKEPPATFGKSSGAPEPMREVIQNKFGNEGATKTHGRYEVYNQDQLVRSQHKTLVRSTRAVEIRANHVKQRQADMAVSKASEPRELFKLSKFKKVECKVDTRRSSS